MNAPASLESLRSQAHRTGHAGLKVWAEGRGRLLDGVGWSSDSPLERMRRRAEEGPSVTDDPSRPTILESQVAALSQVLRVENLVASLTDRQRQVVVLRYVKAANLAAVAAEKGDDAAAMRQALSRGVEAIGKQLLRDKEGRPKREAPTAKVAPEAPKKAVIAQKPVFLPRIYRAKLLGLNKNTNDYNDIAQDVASHATKPVTNGLGCSYLAETLSDQKPTLEARHVAAHAEAPTP